MQVAAGAAGARIPGARPTMPARSAPLPAAEASALGASLESAGEKIVQALQGGGADDPVITLRGTNRASSGGVITDRGTFHQQTLVDAWESAEPGPTGGRLCKTCGKEVHVPPGETGRDWHGSHSPSWTNREFPADATREEVIENYQEGVELECAECNQSRGNRD
jgi:hypothetical protein